MKRALAVILLLCMSVALIPGTASAESDYVLEIKGGTTGVDTVLIDGVSCLKVELYLNGITDERLLESMSFALAFDSAQLTYYSDSQRRGVSTIYSVNSSGKRLNAHSLVLNTGIEGEINFAFASDYGCRIEDGLPMITLYFRVSNALKQGTEIRFTLAEDAYAESIAMADMTGDGSAKTEARTLSADFSPYTVSETAGTIEWNANDVGFKGTTPYVIANGSAQEPRFTVRDADGSVISSKNYDYLFLENTAPGTAYLFVSFKNGYEGLCTSFFKIYLPPTTETSVQNVKDGIKISWAPVKGAAGYVVYRRAWSSTTNGWTTFERWNNTTGTSWTDKTVYAGSRYQYGVKAYFEKRYDQVADKWIGGNVGDNYNLGEVGPLKTTVRITTRTLKSVTGGSKRLDIKWEGSKNFTGYQVQIATDSAFKKNVQTVKIEKATTYETTIKKLKASTTYYVRVRSYHLFEGMTYYGQWSNVINGKTK